MRKHDSWPPRCPILITFRMLLIPILITFRMLLMHNVRPVISFELRLRYSKFDRKGRCYMHWGRVCLVQQRQPIYVLALQLPRPGST
jgi:hypothetical protein